LTVPHVTAPSPMFIPDPAVPPLILSVLPVAENVSVPPVVTFMTVPLVPVMLIVLLSSVSVRVPEVEVKLVKLCVFDPVTNDPAVTVIVPNVTPPVNRVVTPAPPKARDAQAAVAAMVTVPVPLLASKVVLSADVGGPAPGVPPDEVAQLVVRTLFHVPVATPAMATQK